MLNELRLIDLIERVHSDHPHCECGRETITTYHDGGMWLECEIVQEPVNGRVRRLWNAVVAPDHVHSLIAQVHQPEALAA